MLGMDLGWVFNIFVWFSFVSSEDSVMGLCYYILWGSWFNYGESKREVLDILFLEIDEESCEEM